MSKKPGLLYPKTSNNLRIPNVASIRAEVGNRLGVAGQKVKSEAMIKAFADPSGFITDRNDALDNARDKAAQAYFDFFNDLIEAGADIDTATIQANDRMDYIFKSEMAAYDIMHPGMEGAVGGIDSIVTAKKSDAQRLSRAVNTRDIVSKELLNQTEATLSALPIQRRRGRPAKKNTK